MTSQIRQIHSRGSIRNQSSGKPPTITTQASGRFTFTEVDADQGNEGLGSIANPGSSSSSHRPPSLTQLESVARQESKVSEGDIQIRELRRQMNLLHAQLIDVRTERDVMRQVIRAKDNHLDESMTLLDAFERQGTGLVELKNALRSARDCGR
jgi:hypothetical protein